MAAQDPAAWFESVLQDAGLEFGDASTPHSIRDLYAFRFSLKAQLGDDEDRQSFVDAFEEHIQDEQNLIRMLSSLGSGARR